VLPRVRIFAELGSAKGPPQVPRVHIDLWELKIGLIGRERSKRVLGLEVLLVPPGDPKCRVQEEADTEASFPAERINITQIVEPNVHYNAILPPATSACFKKLFETFREMGPPSHFLAFLERASHGKLLFEHVIPLHVWVISDDVV